MRERPITIQKNDLNILPETTKQHSKETMTSIQLAEIIQQMKQLATEITSETIPNELSFWMIKIGEEGRY